MRHLPLFRSGVQARAGASSGGVGVMLSQRNALKLICFGGGSSGPELAGRIGAARVLRFGTMLVYRSALMQTPTLSICGGGSRQ